MGLKNITARRWLQPLRVHLSVVIVLMLLGVSAPLILLNYESGRDAAVVAATEQMGALADRIVDRYRALFAQARLSVGIIAATDSFLTHPSQDAGEKAETLLKALQLSTHLDGIYAGYADGSFIHAVNLENDPAWREALNAPPWASYAVRVTSAEDNETRWSIWRFLDGALETSLPAEQVTTTYDPRVRPWYRLAVKAHGPVVTPPYVMATTRAYAVTRSEPHQGDQTVVIGADVLLDRLSRFLAEEKISSAAKSYVFDRTGRLIVHSDPDVMTALLDVLDRASDVEAAALASRDMLYEPVRKVLDLITADEGQTKIEIDGRAYFVRIVRNNDGTLLNGTVIAVAAPLTDFTGPSDQLLRTNFAVSFSLLALGVAGAFLISRLVSRSLSRLTGEAERFAAFDFTVTEPLETHISEISALDLAIDQARDAIRAFSLYVPRELVRKIVQSGQCDLRSAARQDVTVMFTDIKDFTTISEENAPEAVVAILSRYFELMNPGIERNRGTIVQFLGDSVYAMWNAPVADPDHAINACACALELKAALDELNHAQRQNGQPELITRFGIHSGPAVVGSIGAEDRLQYTAMGDTVNVASRLEGMNKEFGTTILASRQVRDQCANKFAFRHLGPAKVRGRGVAIEVFELTGVC